MPPTTYAIRDRLSENLARSPEGFLIARAATLARSAIYKPMLYKRSELGLGSSDDLVPLYRSREELLHKKFLHAVR